MSILDDARRLAETAPQPINPLARCHWCDQFTLTEPHSPDCPWLALPRIVAALEAAEELVAAHADPDYAEISMVRLALRGEVAPSEDDDDD